jgi:low temperature requirement protein LtrA
MRGRDPDEAHRTSTALELLFDLTFVVAVSQASAQLAHAVVEGEDLGHALVGYLMVFFAIWWAWMNFTWFASAYDIDDVPYRLLTLLQMLGVLVLAAAVPQVFEEQDFRWAVVGYVLMRVAMVAQWLRAAANDPEHRAAAHRYAAGISVVQVGWIAFLWLPDGARLPGFVLLAAAEIAVPAWAERPGMTPWHAEHIAERYGLFVIIVLGECVLGATVALQRTLDAGHGLPAELALTGVAGLALVFSVWWLYFLHPFPDSLERRGSRSFGWGYVHYGVFAALAALGSGLEVAAAALGEQTHATAQTAAWAIAVPVAAFLLLMVLVGGIVRTTTRADVVWKVLAALAVLAVPLVVRHHLAVAVVAVTVPVAALVARGVWQQHRHHRLAMQDGGITG